MEKMKTFIEELDGLQAVLDYQKRALNLIMDSWRKSAETKEGQVNCSCNDPSCEQKGSESNEVAGHIDNCSCGECHQAIGKLR